MNSRLHLLLLILSLVLYKIYLLEINSRAIFNCQWCLTGKAIFFELQFVIFLVTIHLLAGFSRWYWLRGILRLTVIAALIIMAIDLMVLQQFLVHFTLHEFSRFVSEFSAIMDFLKQLLANPWNTVFSAVAISAILGIFSRYLRNDHVTTRSPVFLACLGFCLFGFQFLKPVEYHTPYLQNSIEAFFSTQTRNRPYSKNFSQKISEESDRQLQCFAGKGMRPDLILLVVESLSMYHSALFSGINNWVPQFDALSQKGRWFSNFYANGINTEQGLIALHIGEPPIAKGIDEANGMGSSTALLFEQFLDPKDSLPRMLNELGYHTVFLTTGNLGFLGKGKWLNNIGYNYIEGHDAPYYTGMKRFHFDAPSDSALYDRALQELAAHKKNEKIPIFMTLETVSTHHPYIDPESGTQSEELTFRYADHQLGVFVKNLESNGFFDNGYLMIVSDHRAMVPMNQSEIDRFGNRAYTRIPFSIIGHGLGNGEESNHFSQSDLLPSLRHWLDKSYQCVNFNQGIFLPSATQIPACIFTHRSYNLDNVFVYCGMKDYTINLNGDHTNYINSSKPSTDFLEVIHRLRLSKGY